MDVWLRTCLLLCLYGFFKELRPSEPFLTEYLLGPQQNLTENQVLTSTELMDYHTLNYFSLASVTIAFIIACCLDPVSSSIYFHRQQYLPTSEEDSSVILSDHHIQETIKEKISKVAGFIWNDFKSAYSNKYLLKWSIWWAFATCGNFQVGNYIQPLWESIAPMDENENLYNGAVEASQTLLSALAAFGVGYLHLNWEYFGEGTLAIISLIDGLLLFFMGLTSSIAVGYINYIVFRVSYQVLITVASYQVAKQLKADSYGLVFGINMFISLLLQSLLTFVVVETLEIEPNIQFIIYGVYYMVLAFFFFVLSAYACGKLGCDGLREIDVWEKQPECSNQEPPVGTTEAQ